MANEHRPPVDVTVEVDGDELVAGTMRVTERRGQSMTFEYDRDYLADSRAYALDPALLLGTDVFQPPAGAQIFNAFSDSAPDRWGQDLMRDKRSSGRERSGWPRVALDRLTSCSGRATTCVRVPSVSGTPQQGATTRTRDKECRP